VKDRDKTQGLAAWSLSFFLLLSILARSVNVIVFMEDCQEITCLGLNKDENRYKGSKKNSYPT
jgi:hypothetical protein